MDTTPADYFECRYCDDWEPHPASDHTAPDNIWDL